MLYYSYKICLQNFKRIRAAVEELQIWLEIRWTMSTGASFCSFSLILFLNCSTIATKSVYEISKGSVQWLKSYIIFGLKLGEQCLQVRVFVRFLSFFFNLLYYSYEICLQNFKRIHAAVEELQIWVEIRWTMSTGASFCSFSLILF